MWILERIYYDDDEEDAGGDDRLGWGRGVVGKCRVLQCGKGKAKIVTVREILFSVLSFRHQMTCPKI